MEKDDTKAFEYICIECRRVTALKPKDPIRCAGCGKNMLYKARDKSNPVQLQAI